MKPYTRPANLRPVLPAHNKKQFTWKGAATVQDAGVSDVLHYVNAAQQTVPPKIAVFSAHKYVRVVPYHSLSSLSSRNLLNYGNECHY